MRVLDKAALVEGVGVDHHLHVHVVGHAQAIVDGPGRGAPVLVQLERGRPGTDLFGQRVGQAGVALAREGQVHGQRIGGLQHAPDVPGAGRAGGRQRAVGRAGAAAQHGGDARVQRVLDLLRTDEVDMRVEAPGGEDLALGGDGLGARPDDDIHARLGVGVAGLADGGDAAALQPDVGLVDAAVVEDQRVGDDGVHRAGGAGRLGLAHAVADDLAAAELDLFAVGREILFDLDHQFGVGQPQPVAGGGAVHAGIGGAGQGACHQRSPMTCWLKPKTRRAPP